MDLNISSSLGRIGLLIALTAGCTPGKGDDDGDGTADVTETADVTGESGAPTTGGPMVDLCPASTAVADIGVEWGTPAAPCEMEVCNNGRDVMCKVDAIDSDGSTRISLTCEYEGTGPAKDVVVLGLEPAGKLDLAVGAAVRLTYEASSGFETGSTRILRLTDDRGLVLAAGYINRYGGLSGEPEWANMFLAEVSAPLTATVAAADCADDPRRSAVTVTQGDASVVVAEGVGETLTGDAASWLVVVARASVEYSEIVEGELDVAILRVSP